MKTPSILVAAVLIVLGLAVFWRLWQSCQGPEVESIQEERVAQEDGAHQ